MTNFREPFCIHDAIAHSPDKEEGLGPKLAANVICKSDSTLRKFSDPTNDLYNISVEQAAKLAAAHRIRGKSERYTQAFENLVKDNMSAMGAAPAKVSAADLHRQMMKIVSAIGDTADEVERSTDENGPNGEYLTEAEKRDLLEDARKAEAAIATLIHDIQTAPTDSNVRRMTGQKRPAGAG